MSKHDTGTVRVIPADHTHYFHEVISYDLVGLAYDALIPSKTIIKAVDTIYEPGRHRQFDDTWNASGVHDHRSRQ